MTSPFLPLFKFVGGKRKLAPEIVSLFKPDFETYIEPFVGAGSVFLKLAELGGKTSNRKFVLNDVDKDLIDLWCAIRDHPYVLWTEAKHLIEMDSDDERRYNNLRDEWNFGTRRPALNLVLRASSFNGLFRVNKRGRMNAAWNKSTPKILVMDRLMSMAKILGGVEFRCESFAETMQPPLIISPKSIFYCDPPYLGGWTSYTGLGWSRSNAVLLAIRCHKLTLAGAQVVLSHSNTGEFREILSTHWPSLGKIHTIGATRLINCNGAGRGKVAEIVVVGNP